MEQALEPESDMTDILQCSDWECKTPMVYIGGSLIAQLVKNLPAMKETLVFDSGLGKFAGEGIGYPLQYSWASLGAQSFKN